jgi:O-antigen ligase
MWPICHAGWGVLVVWSMLQPLDSVSVFVGNALPQNLGWLILAWIVSIAVWSSGWRWPLRIAEVGVLLMILVGMFAVTIHSGWNNNPRTGWNGFWHIVGLLSFYSSLRCLLTSDIVRSMLAVILFAGSVALAIESAYQLLVEFPEQRRQYASDPQRMLKEVGISAAEGSAQRMRFEARLHSPEPLATYALTNSLAVQLSGALVAGMSLLYASLPVVGRTQRSRDRKVKAPSPGPQPKSGEVGSEAIMRKGGLSRIRVQVCQWAMIGQMAILISIWFATRSRAAFLAVGATMLMGLIWRLTRGLHAGESAGLLRLFKRSGPLLFCVAIGCLATIGVLWIVFPDWLSAAVRSAAFRRDYWAATWQMLADHGWFGVGLGNFQSYYPRYMLPTASETIADPHNWVLDLAVTCSVPLALLMIGGLFRLLTIKPLPCPGRDHSDGKTADRDKRNACWLAVGAVFGAVVVLAGVGILERPVGSLAFAVVLACLLAAWTWPLARHQASEVWWGHKLAAIAMLLCLLVSGSWQAPGLVVGLLCYLVSGAGWQSETAGGIAQQSMSSKRSVALLVPVCFTLLLIGFIWQSWNPVLRSSAEVHGVFSNPASQRDAARRAAQIDPWDAGWNRYQIELSVQAAVVARNAADFERWQEQINQSIQRWTERESVSFLTWQRAGEHYLELAAKANDWGLAVQPLLHSAGKCYENATYAYPTSVQLRIQLAYCLLRLGDLKAARHQIGIAEQLDQGTLHIDRKIGSQLIWMPEPPNGWSAATNREQYWRPAEPAVAWIRSQL